MAPRAPAAFSTGTRYRGQSRLDPGPGDDRPGAPRLTRGTGGADDEIRQAGLRVDLGQRKGRISIEFGNVDDLNRILDALAPQEDGISATAKD